VAQVAVMFPAMAPAAVSGEILAPVFFWLSRQVKRAMAIQRVQQTSAVSLAVGMVMGEKDAVLRLAEKDVREAFPDG
jgi:hypothetical protein